MPDHVYGLSEYHDAAIRRMKQVLIDWQDREMTDPRESYRQLSHAAWQVVSSYEQATGFDLAVNTDEVEEEDSDEIEENDTCMYCGKRADSLLYPFCSESCHRAFNIRKGL